ncbi:MAG: DMT family transporter [Candidatus Hydrogenedens sp.]
MLSPYFYMLCSAFCFAIMAVCGSMIGNNLSWTTVAFFRIAPTFIFVVTVAFIRKEKVIIFSSLSLWLRSILGTIALLCTFYSLSRMNATDAVTISATTPIWVTLIMYILFSDKVPSLFWLFVISTFLGIYLIEKPQFKGDFFPIFIAFLGAICAGSAMVSLSFCGLITPITVVSHYSLVALMTTFCIFYLSNSDMPAFVEILEKYGVLLVVIGLSGTLGQIFLTYAYGTGKPQWVSITGLSQVIFTTLLELLLNKLKLNIELISGMIIVLTSISCVIWIKHDKKLAETT